MATDLVCNHKSDPDKNGRVRLDFQARNDEEMEREDHILGLSVVAIVTEEAAALFEVGHVGFTLAHAVALPERVVEDDDEDDGDPAHPEVKGFRVINDSRPK